MTEGYRPQQNTDSLSNAEKARSLVEGSEPAMARLVEQLRSNIESGAYRAVIGDDASGRIPALILSKVISEVNQLHGNEKPVVRFIGGGFLGGPDRNELAEHVGRILREADVTDQSRVLIVTEHIATGAGLSRLVRELRKREVNFDVAVMRMGSDHNVLSGLSYQDRGKLSIYDGKHAGKSLYNKGEISGVERTSGNSRNLFRTVYRDNFPEGSESRRAAQETINESRSVVDEIAQRLVQKFKNSDNDEAA